mgnify:CR=1 FL=1
MRRSVMVTRAKFNPDLKDLWFTSVMQVVINNLTMITVILTGAAVIRAARAGHRRAFSPVMPVVPARSWLPRRSWRTASSFCWPPGFRSLFVVQWWLKVAKSQDQSCCFSAARPFMRLHRRGPWHSSRHSRGHNGPVRAAGDPVLLVMMLLSGGTTPMAGLACST